MAALTLMLASSPVRASERLYRVIDLGPIIINSQGFIAGFPGDGNVTFGINSKNQIAFARVVDGTMHAHVFLPAPDYGLDTLGFTTLAAFAEWGSTASLSQLEGVALTFRSLMAP